MRRLALAPFILLALGGIPAQSGRIVPAAPVPTRIVSLAPSVTEVLFAIGLGDRIVGVTTYCRYPPRALALPKIGGYLTPSYEALAAVQPDLAVLLPEHDDLRSHLEALRIPVLRVDHNSIASILESATTIGERCGVAREATAFRTSLETELNGIAHTIAGRSRPRVVICLGRNADASAFRSMSAAGPGGIYDDLIERAGGTNAIPPGPVLHPSLSAEALLQIDPDVIVEFASNGGLAARLREQWRSLSSLRAARDGRVYIFTQDFLSIPGPRLVHFVGDLARALHPDASWK
jgi:iron complex transport system substrate-binding protein